MLWPVRPLFLSKKPFTGSLFPADQSSEFLHPFSCPPAKMKHSALFCSVFFLGSLAASHAADSTTKGPNIVYILADDLGVGDVRCLNPAGKFATPNLDKLASQGMIFTDAHSSSAVCTPSRYTILTGRYNWRSRLQASVFGGYDAPLIKASQTTVPSLLKKAGYHTACIGKWHLGMTMAPAADPKQDGRGVFPIDFTKPIQDGPTTRGFDYYYGISASLDMPPYAYIENDHWTQIPTVEKDFKRKGAAAVDFEAVDVLPTLTRKACSYFEERAKAGTPFFLYMPINSPHTPLVPTPEWKGKSGYGDYGDFVMETDWSVGEIMAALERTGLTQNTLLVVTSDNGCAPYIGAAELEQKGHFASGASRGYKSDIWDGGHRVPFIARWPEKVPAKTKCNQLVYLGDLMATCAELTDAKLSDNEGEDSVSIPPALLGRAEKPLREAVVHHSISGRFAIRQGNWKLELCPGSGGWSKPVDSDAAKQGLPLVQLYDLGNDCAEQHNVQAEHPEVVTRLTALLEKIIADGRSTPGQPQANDAEIDLWKKNLNEAKKAKAAQVDPTAN